MRAIGIIPTRLGATRFPGKPMAQLCGMPMVGHCYHRTRLALGLEAAHVATCDPEIADYVRSIGGSAIMTATFVLPVPGGPCSAQICGNCAADR